MIRISTLTGSAARRGQIFLAASNLMRLAKEGSSLKSVATRLRELEEIQEKLKEEKTRLQGNCSAKGSEANIVGVAASYLENFESKILTARIAGRKELLRRAVEMYRMEFEFPFLKEYGKQSWGQQFVVLKANHKGYCNATANKNLPCFR